MDKTPARPRIWIARDLRRTETSPEELLWRELRSRRLDGWRFRRQVPIAGHVVDFACVAARLTIELDGKQHLDQPDQDAERTAKIAAAGTLSFDSQTTISVVARIG